MHSDSKNSFNTTEHTDVEVIMVIDIPYITNSSY